MHPRLVAAAVVLLGAAAPAAADDEAPPTTPPREARGHVWIGLGGSLGNGGPQALGTFVPGLWAGLGGSWGRWGGRADVREYDQLARREATAQLVYEFGRTGRHVVLAGTFGGGVAWPEPSPLLLAGIAGQVTLTKGGLIVLVIEGTLHVDAGSALDAYFVSTLGVALAR